MTKTTPIQSGNHRDQHQTNRPATGKALRMTHLSNDEDSLHKLGQAMAEAWNRIMVKVREFDRVPGLKARNWL